jgi:thioredoxin reductase (NADPH)
MEGASDAARSVVFAVDDDEQSLERIRRELTSRYGTDYRVVCEGSAGSALEALEEMRSRCEAVALVLAAQWMDGIRGVELLAKVGELHPLAKRALLIDWGGWGHRPTAEAIFAGIAQRHMDYYVMRPRRPPDEQFHRTVTEFLQEWARTRSRPSPGEVVLVAHRPSRRGYELRELLTRNGIPHAFRTSDSAEGRRILRDCGVAGSDLPVALMHDGRTLVDPSSTDLVAAFGVETEIGSDRTFDVIVVGAGPAGLTAAVYASSEGLSTLVVEREAIGGQAGSSALIRNYLGFSRGVSGAELAQRAYQQAWVFGTKFLLMREVAELRADDDHFAIDVGGVGQVTAGAVVLAMGVSYRRIGIPSLEDLIGSGVFYGTATSEAAWLEGEHIYVVGGGNSAGQAVMHLSRYAGRVTLLVRGAALDDTMSRYLVGELEATENVDIRIRTEVANGGGDGRLEWLDLRDNASGEVRRVEAAGLFLMIGAVPHTDWLPENVERDRGGYLLTGLDLVRDGKVVDCWPLARSPRLLETSLPGLFAAGDVRHGSISRVASAVGDGSVVISQIHQARTRPQHGAKRRELHPAG